jgi:acyl-CoA synthetase (AMP-forming)/AMP-acid ligase II
MTNADTADKGTATRFLITKDSTVVSEDRSRILPKTDLSTGWLARTGAVPLGYLGDQARTEATFPVIEGVRYVIGGDRVHRTETGSIRLLGRESFTINSGGEKIFAEEVEQAIKQHAGVADVTVVGRPNPRWGQEVTALVELRPDTDIDRAALLQEAARHIARYKLPKAFLFVDKVQRGASGKTDIQWARALAKDAT